MTNYCSYKNLYDNSDDYRHQNYSTNGHMVRLSSVMGMFLKNFFVFFADNL